MADHPECLKTEERPRTAEAGLLLLDRSLKIVAYDRGATSILKDPNYPAVQQRLSLPKDVVDNLRECKLTALSSLRIYLPIGESRYVCRAYLLEWLNWLAPQPMIAVHLTKISGSNDAVQDATVRYKLTKREQEVLRGLSLGLSNKAIAERMEIAPNTVKAFLTGIMTKMGVHSRAGVIATTLQTRPTVDRYSVSSVPPARS